MKVVSMPVALTKRIPVSFEEEMGRPGAEVRVRWATVRGDAAGGHDDDVCA